MYSMESYRAKELLAICRTWGFGSGHAVGCLLVSTVQQMRLYEWVLAQLNPDFGPGDFVWDWSIWLDHGSQILDILEIIASTEDDT